MKKLQVLIITAVCLVTAVVIYQVWQNGRPADDQLRAALETDAYAQLTNAVYKVQPGVSRIIEAKIDSQNPNPTNWLGSATVDYVNHTGGVDRKVLIFRFGRSGMSNVYCYQDPAGGDFELQKVGGH